jgi:flagellar FliJ protein
MIKPFSLQPLLNLAQHQNDSATRKLGQLNKQQQSAQSKLEVLQQYRRDYQTRLQEATQNGINPAELRNFQEFINKLDEAIGQQLKVVGQSKVSTQAGRGEFDTAQRKLKSFDTLQQRHIKTQKIVAEKSEQLALDEHTGRASSYKTINAEKQDH